VEPDESVERDDPVPATLHFDPTVVLEGERIRLRPFRDDDLDAAWRMVQDPEGTRLTGTHARFTRGQIERWYRTRGQTTDRLDLAVARREDDAFVGEGVLHEVDVDNRSCGLRISLAGAEVFGRGYGTEATRLLVGHAFEVGFHRVGLEVFAFNERARRTYEKVGFVVEGVRRDALRWDGSYHDAILMSVLAHEWRPAAGDR
jgi:RimJ/RimL family protein N-acetyltransferase